MGPITIGAIAAVTSAVITAAGLGLAWYTRRRDHRLLVFGHKAQWSRDVRAWAAQAMEALTEAIYSNEESACEQQLFKCRWRLSSLIEIGRLYFPNVMQDDYGLEKLPAYRGYLHSVLDPLVASIKILEGDKGNFTTHRAALLQMRRHFVSQLVEVLNLVQGNEELVKMVEKAHQTNKSALEKWKLTAPETVPPGAFGLLYPER